MTRQGLSHPITKIAGKLGVNIIAEGGIEENMQYMIQAANSIPLLDDQPNMGGA